MTDVVKASVLLVEIGPDPVRVTVLTPTEIGHWEDPCTEGAPIVQQDLSGRPLI